MSTPIYIGYIDAAVGANKSMMRLGNQNSTFAPHHPLALRQSQFDHTRINTESLGPNSRTRGRLDRLQVFELTFSLRDDFVFYNEDVAQLQNNTCRLECLDRLLP